MNKFDIDEGNTCKIPIYIPNFEEISKQMRINCDILKKEFSKHVNDEIERFYKTVKNKNG